MSRPRTRLLTALSIVVGAAGLWFLRPDSVSNVATRKPDATVAPDAASGSASDSRTLSRSDSIRTQPSPAVAAAVARRERLLGLIATDPALALAESVSVSDYAALPAEVLPFYERPFHAIAALDVLPVCGDGVATAAGASAERHLVLRLDGAAYQAVSTGARVAAFSRDRAPLHGFILGGRAVVSDSPLAILSGPDADLLSHLPLGQRDGSRDFATGQPLGSSPTVAVAGDRRFLFASPASAEAFNLRLAALDSRPGPHAGAAAALALPYSANPSAGFDWAAAESAIDVAASAWTETPKSSFFIRADFPDVAGSLPQATLANLINTGVASAITSMSYGKTTVSAVVSAEMIRLPQNSTAYVSNSGLLHDDAVAVYKAIHGSSSLDGYDIIGVQFPSISANSGGVIYAGLASVGGTRHWLQGSPSSDTVIHEFGHNYGLGHASFWSTSDGNPVSPSGSTVEYGDSFDVMGSGDAPEAHFHQQAKALLNWITPSQWVDANAAGSGTYRLHRFDDPSTTGGLRGLRVIKEPSANASSVGYYWVGYRPGISDNAFLPRGAYLIWERPGNNRSWLVDTTPASARERVDSALLTGRTYSDAVAGVHFTPLATGGSGADAWLDMRVEIGSFPGNQAPSATFSPTLTVAARSARSFSVSATDPEGDSLAYGWDFGDGSAPANAASVTQSWTVGGSYPVSVVVSDMKGGLTTRSATITVTDPLLDWPSQTVSANRTLRSVAFLRGRHFVGGNNYVYTSLDRASWRESRLGDNYRSTDFAADSGAFVAVGYDYDFDLDQWVGVVHRSLDGAIWEKITLPATVSYLRSVAASGAGVFVAVGDDGRLLRSADSGATWSVQTVPTLTDFTAIDFGNGLFMAVGDRSVFTSADGSNWTDRSSAVLLESWQSSRTVAFSNQAWYAGGWYTDVHRSADGGQTWSKRPTIGSGTYTVDGIAPGPGVLVASVNRQENNTASPEFLVSVDGLTWTEITGSAPFSATESVAYADGAFVSAENSTGTLQRSGSLFPSNQAPVAGPIRSVGTTPARRIVAFAADVSDADSDALTCLWDFGDGSAYAEGINTSHLFGAGGNFTVKLHVVDGRGGITTVTKNLTVTEPLATWTPLASGTSANLRDIAADGAGKLVAVGGSSGTYRVSTDSGATWSAGGTLGTNISLYGLCHAQGRFVAVGQDYDFGVSNWVGVIYTSTDGLSWSRLRRAGPVLRDVVHGGGRFLACGDSGTILISSDAVTWNTAASGTTINLQGVAYGQGTYVIGGANGSSQGGTILVSANGEVWTNTSAGLGTGQGLFELDFVGDRFLASGFYADIRHSTDGGVTFASTTTGNPQAAGFAKINGLTLAVAKDLDNANADQNLVSFDGVRWTALPTADTALRNAVLALGDRFISVGDAGEIWLSAAVPASSSGYTDWRTSQFIADPAVGEPGLDADADGASNLAEYVAGTDPLSSASRPSFVTEVLAGELTLTVPLGTSSSDVIVRFETSTDLATWTESGVIVLEAPGEIVGSVPLDQPRRFLRARYILAP